MSMRTFMIFVLTIVTMVALASAGGVVYANAVAPNRHQFVGALIFWGMLGSVWLGSLAMGYSTAQQGEGGKR